MRGGGKGGRRGGPGTNLCQITMAHLHLAKIELAIQHLRLGLRESITINLLGNAFLITDSTCCEGCYSLVTVQVSAPNLDKHICRSRQCQVCKVRI